MPEKIKPKCKLIGEDSNVFNLLNIVTTTLTRNKMKSEAKECVNKIFKCNSYAEALSVFAEYVEIV